MKEQTENQERLNLGTLLLLDSFNRAGAGLKSVSDESKILSKGFSSMLRVMVQSLKESSFGFRQMNLMLRILSEQGQKSAVESIKAGKDEAAALVESTKAEKDKAAAIEKSIQVSIAQQKLMMEESDGFMKIASSAADEFMNMTGTAGEGLSNELDAMKTSLVEAMAVRDKWRVKEEAAQGDYERSRAVFNRLQKVISALGANVGPIVLEAEKRMASVLGGLHDTMMQTRDGLATANDAVLDFQQGVKSLSPTFGDKMLGGLDKMSDGALEASNGIKSGITAPLKAIPMQIGSLLVRPLTRLLDPFMDVLDDLTLITEPLVGLFEIFLAPLQEVIGLISNDMAVALLGNEDMLADVTAAGRQLAGTFYLMWGLMKPIVNAIAPLMPLLLQMGTLLYFVIHPIQVLLAALGLLAHASQPPEPQGDGVGGPPSGGGGAITHTNIYVSGSVISERQLNRTNQGGMI